ncbi:MAG: TylF/MycF/NovP-related O-methyltransferase [Candidatus Omnitrophota bacterium]|nr:TylF/MycF/NovP-related O-methyltransferase [Candidatus Omnitrophota bacterium]
MFEEKLEQVGVLINRHMQVPSGIRAPIKKFLNRGREQKKILSLYKEKLINESEIARCYGKAIQYLKHKVGKENIGDYFEFGVCRGTSMKCMYDELEKAGLSDVRLWGFDSFEGLPPCDDGHWKAGSFKSNYQHTKKLLTDHGVDWKRAALIKGWYSDTLSEDFAAKHKIKKASLIMVDCDIYSSTKEALDFIGPLIKDHSVVFFDDWNPLARDNKGEKRAFDEFLAAHPEFRAEEFDEYSYSGNDLNGKVFTLHAVFNKIALSVSGFLYSVFQPFEACALIPIA